MKRERSGEWAWVWPYPTVAIAAMSALLVFGSGLSSALAIWLPWAKEEQKIDRRANDIWGALLANDKATAKKYLVGNAVDPFIDLEMSVIKTKKIKKITCKAEKVQLDKVRGEFAFVELAKTATLESGMVETDRFLKVFRKVGDDWMLITDADQSPKKKAASKSAEKEPKDFFDLVMERLPGAEAGQ